MPDRIKVLFLGDLMGHPGRRALHKFLPQLVKKHMPEVVVANGENAAGGIGITEEIGKELFLHVDVLTSGNHIWDKKEVFPYLEKEPRLIRPANYPRQNPGKGSYIYQDGQGLKIAVLNLQGRVFMEPLDCPFRRADEEVEVLRAETPNIIVDFHAEATSEKQALGWYLDGRVSAVVGTHTHVPTADEKVLPGGTAYITDVGMTGPYGGIIGFKPQTVLERFLLGTPRAFEPATTGGILSGAVIDVDEATGRARSIRRLHVEEDRTA